MAKFVLENNYFEFHGIYNEASETVIGTKFAPSYACIFRENVENKFRESAVDIMLLTLDDFVCIF